MTSLNITPPINSSPTNQSPTTVTTTTNTTTSATPATRGKAQRGNSSVTSPPPEVRVGSYILHETIGRGSFGKVKLATHTITNEKVAVKMVNNSKISNAKAMRKISREVKILKLFQHPHIVRLYDVIPTNTDVFIVQEYVPGGELYDFIVKSGKLPEAQARRFFQQIISGVEYCHHFRVVHRDLKPENLLIDSSGNLKIIDFGLSNLMRDGDFLVTSCGSPNYAAPEVISGKHYAGPEVDVWSCGVILYALLCGHLPFDEETIPALFAKIRKGVFTIPAHVTSEARDLLLSILQVDPLRRLTIPQIRSHVWFLEQIPAYLEWTPAEYDRLNHIIDEDIVIAVAAKVGTTPDAVRSCVVNQVDGDAYVSYSIWRDEKARKMLLQDLASSTTTTTTFVSKSVSRPRETSLPPQPGSGGPQTVMLGTSPVMHTLLGNANMKQQYNSIGSKVGSPTTLGVGVTLSSEGTLSKTAPGSSKIAFSVRSPSTAAQGSLTSQTFVSNMSPSSFRGGSQRQNGSIVGLEAQYTPEEMTYLTQNYCGWRLGCMTDVNSQQLTNEIYSVLTTMQYEWRVKAPFLLQCKPIGKEHPVLSVAIYRLQDRHDRGYVVDFSVVGGSVLLGADAAVHLYHHLAQRVG